uniref:HTH-type transcriptional repressor YvoA n=1 Tax=Thermogemmatispora argillosa TaxID=2045280 RepID=A0A455SXI2_9CHLR|nr:HTH-type transcriptional repressor YvoA [Thermogemmatispora argillosa]
MQEAAEEPLYRRITRILREEIERSRKPGDPIETEQELEKRFNVSRITVRRAVEELVREGLLTRRRGSGTFVAQRRVVEELGTLKSWTEQMRELGLEPHTVDCQILKVVPPSWVARALGLSEEQPELVLRVQRLRYASGEPLALMIDYLPVRYVPDLAEKGLEGESLYETLEKRYGLRLAHVEDTVTAREATHLEANLLGIDPKAPVLYVKRVTYLENGDPVDAANVISRADRYEYRMSGRLPGRRFSPSTY